MGQSVRRRKLQSLTTQARARSWAPRQLHSLPTSMKPSTEAVASICPSGENWAASGWEPLPKRMTRSSCEGKRSTASRCPCAVPLNRSRAVPGGSRPWCCCLWQAVLAGASSEECDQPAETARCCKWRAGGMRPYARIQVCGVLTACSKVQRQRLKLARGAAS